MLIFMLILLKCNVAYVVLSLKIVCIKLGYSLRDSSPDKMASAWLVRKLIPFTGTA